MKRTILVTGANRGIGLAITEALAGEPNDHILLGCRNVKNGGVLAEKIGNNVTAVAIDLENRAQLATQIKTVLEEHGDINVLINNAGVLCEGTFDEVSESDIDTSLRVNTLGALELIRAVVPGMKKSSYGRIVNVSSGWGSFAEGLRGPFSYSLTKAAINAITFTIWQSLPATIKINSMCPGWVRTRMGGMNAARSPEQGAETAVWLANLGEDGPTGGFFRDKKRINW